MTELKVVRYYCCPNPDLTATRYAMNEDPEGDWVGYSDYEALAARVQELEGWQEEAFLDVVRARAEAKHLRERSVDCEELRHRIDELESMWPDQSRLTAENTRLREALDQYREDADEWKCPTCGEWQRPWQMYCDKDECRAALKEKP